MAGERFLKENAGVITEVVAVQVGGGASADKIPSLDANGLLDASMMPVGIGADTASIVSSENIAAGDFVNIYDNGGTPTIRKAIADGTGKTADGFVLNGVTSPAAGLVYFEGKNTAKSGLTIGAKYFLSSTVAGGVTTTAPNGAGQEVQSIGKAISATSLTTENMSGTIVKKA
jgi:predicted small secreted protein